MKMTQYKPEIDSLRAISVLGVIFFHYNFFINDSKLFSGGFLGVDIFFVISGYLISKIIISQVEKGQFSYVNFIERRARRILPALFFLLFVSIFVAFLLFSKENYNDFFKSLIAASFFYSNLYFHFQSIEYGAIEGIFEPLLHTWSLSIEEQFYLFFPFVILIVYKFFYQFRFLLFALISLSSFILCVYLSRHHPSFNFYFFGTRIWEFGFGFFLAYREVKKKNKYFFYLGLLLILYSLFFFQNNHSHPSYLTLVPVLGSYLYIGHFSSEYTNLTFLKKGLLPFIGKISYSLYLWHYLIFVFLQSFFLFSDFNINLFLPFVFLISFLSYKYIETPFRNKNKFNFTNLIKILSISFISIISLSFLLSIPKNHIENDKYKIEGINLENMYYYNKKNKIYKNISKIFKKNELNKILIIGNSHARDLFMMFELNNTLHNVDFAFEWMELNKFFNFIIEDEYHNDSLTNKYKQADYIILSSFWTNYEFERFEKLMKKINSKNKKLILSSGNPFFSNFEKDNYQRPFTIIDKFLFKYKKLPNNDSKKMIGKLYFDSFSNNIAAMNSYSKIKNLSLDKNIPFIDIISSVCDFELKICNFLTSNDEKLLYDDDHFTINGMIFLGRKIKLKELF